MEQLPAEVIDLHRRAIVCDGHCDTILELDRGGRSLKERSSQGHVDLPRLLEGGVTGQIFALFIEDHYLPGMATRRVLQLLDRFYGELQANQDRMLLATRAAEIRQAKTEGKVAGILGIEGGEALEGDITVLRTVYRLGVRLITLTWSRRNAIADGVYEGRTGGGLSTFGVEVVREMNRLGMLVDVAHLAPAGVRDVLEVSQAPVIASHANSRAVCDHRRNLTDEQARAIALSGGLIGVTFVPHFVDRQGASLERLLDHIEHLLGVAGENHVGLGSDYDGFGYGDPAGQFHDLPDVSQLPRLTAGMLQRGLSERVVEKVLGGNFLRVFEEVVG